MRPSKPSNFLSLCAFFLVLTSCEFGNKEKKIQPEQANLESSDSLSVTLEQVWETDTTSLLTPESVSYDPERKLFYVSNLNWAEEAENDGFLAIVNADGSINDARWVEGLNTPLGNTIYEGHLYQNDKNNILKVNLESGEIVERISVENAERLNGIDIDENGNIYSADSGGNKVFRITPEREISVVYEGEDLNSPNGVLVNGKKLLTASSGGGILYDLDLESGELETLADSLGHTDGIILLENGHLITTSWTGQIFFISNEMEVQKLLDTEDQEINAADATFIPEQDLLVLPTFFDNRLVAYKVKIN